MDDATFRPELTQIDAGDILARFHEDPDLMREIIDLFVVDFPERVAAMYAALDHNDAAELRLQAHSLKGSAGAIGAGQVAAAAAAVEALARNGALADAGPACTTVEEALAHLAPFLSRVLAAAPADVAAA